MSGWSFPSLLAAIASSQPEVPALVQGDRRRSWGELAARTSGLARSAALGDVTVGANVGLLLKNSVEYLEAFFGAAAAGFVPFNTNYRYRARELRELWCDAGAEAIVYHGAFADVVDEIRTEVPTCKRWIHVEDGIAGCPEWAVAYEDAIGDRGSARLRPSGDGVIMIYTGGTTGRPKGVLWSQHDLVTYFLRNLKIVLDPADVEGLASRLRPGRLRVLPAAPLMHTTGLFASLQALTGGGTVVLTTAAGFDPRAVLETIERDQVSGLAIVGDSFARPLLELLDDGIGDVSTLKVISSSGAVWSEPVKRGLLKHNPHMLLVDMLGASEAVGTGIAVSTGDATTPTASFSLNPGTRVIDEHSRDVQAGSGQIGMLAVPGPMAVGYHNDPSKSSTVFRDIDGIRYAVTGDWARVDADGSITFVGRGSGCINTGGEKVFAEEVEEVLKEHPIVRDAAVVGLPDPRWGEAVVAVVETTESFDEAELISWAKSQLAPYKAPKRVVSAPSIERGPNGKLDYSAVREIAADGR